MSTQTAPKSASKSTPKSAPPWESPEWQEAVRQNPGLKPFFDNLESFVELPEGVSKLRELALQLAARGKLVEQDENEDNASDAITLIAEERDRLVKSKEIRKQKKLTPITEDDIIHPIPDNWIWTRLGELVDYNGRDKVKSEEIEADDWLLDLKDIEKHTSRLLERSPFKDSPSKSTKTQFFAGDVLYGKLRPYLNKVIVADQDGYCTTEIVPLRIYRDVDPDFLKYLLRRPDFLNHVNELTYGINLPRLGTDDARNVPIPLPPLAEQRRIVSKVEGLMSLCDTLESHRRARESVRERASRSMLAILTSAPRTASTGERPKAAPKRQASGVETLASAWQRLSDHFEVLLDQPSGPAHLRQSILQLAVQGKLVPQDPSDEPASESLDAISTHRSELLKAGKINKAKKLPDIEDDEKPFDEIPDSWAWVRVTDVFDVSGGITKNPKRKPVENHFPYVRVANVQRGRLELDEIARFELFDDDLDRWRLEPNDLLVVEGNGSEKEIGRCAIWSGEIKDCVHQNHIIRCRPIAHEGHTFALRFLNSPAGMDAMKKRAITTSGLYSLSVGKIRSLVIPLPPKAEQKRIVSKVSVLLSQLDELSARLRSRQSTTDDLLTALIHQILEGSE